MSLSAIGLGGTLTAIGLGLLTVWLLIAVALPQILVGGAVVVATAGASLAASPEASPFVPRAVDGSAAATRGADDAPRTARPSCGAGESPRP